MVDEEITGRGGVTNVRKGGMEWNVSFWWEVFSLSLFYDFAPLHACMHCCFLYIYRLDYTDLAAVSNLSLDALGFAVPRKHIL